MAAKGFQGEKAEETRRANAKETQEKTKPQEKEEAALKLPGFRQDDRGFRSQYFLHCDFSWQV